MATSEPRSLLFIIVDDLRPELGCYGNPWACTPNIDALARRGMLFERAYCQNPLCSPSRTSMLTGLRPDSTRIFDNSTHFRAHNPDVVTLPQHLKNHGYHTQAVGKVLHSCFDSAYVGRSLDDPPSWSAPSWFAPPRYYFTEMGDRVAREVYLRQPDCGLGNTPTCQHNRLQEAVGRVGTNGDEWPEHFIQGLIAEAPDNDDEAHHDGQVAARAVEALEAMGSGPFFLAVGFMKPHTPYVAPKRYWDLYRDLPLAALPADSDPPEGVPVMALLPGHDHEAYTGVTGRGAIGSDEARRLIRGYLACVSFMDAQVGRVLDALQRAGLAENTTVVLTSDHGYCLGENSRWGKQTCFENSCRVPLIVAAPGDGPVRSSALVESVDIYPTLCDIAGAPAPVHVEGSSMLPLLRDPSREWKTAAFSQFPRPVRESRPDVAAEPDDLMGRTMRTACHRFTLWHKVADHTAVVARELYNYHADPNETRNLASDAAHAPLVAILEAQLVAGWRAAMPPRPDYE